MRESTDSDLRPSALELERIQWLTSDGVELLLPLEGGNATPRHPKLEDWQSAMLSQQVALRKRSRSRFPDPNHWLWTDRSLSQASDWWTARFKADLIPDGVSVIDACCGGGADSVALALRHQVTAIDSNPICVELARSNLRQHQVQGKVQEQVIGLDSIRSADWLHIDPDRRATGHKSVDASEFSPTLDETLQYAQNAEGSIIKLAPKTTATELADDTLGAMRIWTGWGGECRQQLVLLGAAKEEASRRLSGSPANRNHNRLAAVLMPRHGEENSEVFSGMPEECEITHSPGSFVHELSPSLHAADLQGCWANQKALKALHSSQGYFTSDEVLRGPFAQSFQVLEEVGWDDRKVRKRLRGLDAGVVEVKCRLLTLDANQFQKRYSRAAGRPITILVTRMGNRTRAILTCRVARNGVSEADAR